MASVGVHDPDVVVVVEGVAAVTYERDPPPVRRPGGGGVVCWTLRQPVLPAPVGVHDVDLEVAVTVALEGDLRVRLSRPHGRTAPGSRRGNEKNRQERR